MNVNQNDICSDCTGILKEPVIYHVSKDIHDPKDLGIHLGLKFSEEIIPIFNEHKPDLQAVSYQIITVSTHNN